MVIDELVVQLNSQSYAKHLRAAAELVDYPTIRPVPGLGKELTRDIKPGRPRGRHARKPAPTAPVDVDAAVDVAVERKVEQALERGSVDASAWAPARAPTRVLGLAAPPVCRFADLGETSHAGGAIRIPGLFAPDGRRRASMGLGGAIQRVGLREGPRSSE